MNDGTTTSPVDACRETVILIRPRAPLVPTTVVITDACDSISNEPGHLELGTGLPWAAFAIQGAHVPASTDEVFELLIAWCDEVAGVEYSPVKRSGTVSFVDSLPVTAGEVLELGSSAIDVAPDNQRQSSEKPADLAIEESENVSN